MGRAAHVRPAPGPARFVQVSLAEDHGDSLYTVREVAQQLGVHPETIRRLIHDGRLEAVRVGRVLRVGGSSLDGFLARQRVKPTRIAH
jgi:excisionase family DNA binding protein